VKKLIQILGIVALAIVVILNIVYTADMNSGEQISIKFSGFIYIIGLLTVIGTGALWCGWYGMVRRRI